MDYNTQDRIDAYIRGEMNASERASFSKDLSQDNELRKDYEFTRNVANSISDRERKKRQIREWNRNGHKTVYMYSTIMSIAAMLVVGLFLFNNISKDNTIIPQDNSIVYSEDFCPPKDEGQKIPGHNYTSIVKVPIDSADAVERAKQIGQSGNLQVTLLWDFQGDIDLHVTQPNGNTINYKESKDVSTGGFLDVDNTNGGSGSVENIFWANPPKGKYKVSLVYYQASQKTNAGESGTCTVIVFQEGKRSQIYQVEMTKVKESKDVVELFIE